MVGIWKNGTPIISIGSDHYPDSNITIRIDKNKPITAPAKAGFSKDQTKAILEQMNKGDAMLTRYNEWPYQHDFDTQVDSLVSSKHGKYCKQFINQ